MNTFRNGLVLVALSTAIVLVSSPKEEETKPAPPPTKTDVARVVHVVTQTLPQRLKRSPHEARRLICRVTAKVPDEARIAGACHNYPHLAFRGHSIPFA